MSPPTRLVVAGQLLDDEPTGAAVHLREVVRAVLAQRPGLDVVARHVTSRGRASNIASAARISPLVRPVTTPVPATVLRALQQRLRWPSERTLLGDFDVYHQFHTDCDPAVPDDRLVVTLHDTVALTWPAEEGAMFAGAGRLLRRARAVITVSEFSRTAICEAFGVEPARVHVVPNGVDHGRFHPGDASVGGPAERPYLLVAGGHTPRKNLDRVLAAFARLHETRPSLQLVVVGPAAAREAELRGALPGGVAADALTFAGFVSPARLVELYRHAEALVYPSLQEGFGMPILEAMACGTPVVTSDRGAMREVAGGAATLVDPTSPDAIATGVAGVLDADGTHRSQLRRAGLARAAEFTWAAAGHRTLQVYDDVAGR